MGQRLIIYDLFAGTGSATQAFVDAGHTVIKVEIDEHFEAHERNVFTLNADYLIEKYGRPHFVWASPPCTSFSVASIGKHWTKDKQPKTREAEIGIKLVDKTLRLINELKPVKGWLMENPRGMLRKQELVKDLPMRTITYCQYGDTRMKPTDLWGIVPGWTPRPACKAGDGCHDAAPRGSRTGTQGLKGAKVRSMIPIELSQELLGVITNVDNS
jgi:hypothetical protein